MRLEENLFYFIDLKRWILKSNNRNTKVIFGEILKDLLVPLCVLKILDELGFYSNSTSISVIQPDDIEQHIKQELCFIVNDFDCYNSETYQNQKVFCLLPGHRKLILKLKNHLQEMKTSEQEACLHQNNKLNPINEFSFLLKTLIETANKLLTQYQYNKTIRNFAVYIYLQCGKMCYETICGNLPLPQPRLCNS